MKLDRVSFYQAIEIPSKEKRINANTVSEETFPGVQLELADHLIKVSHSDWHEDVYVGTSNVRYATTKKESVITFEKVVNHNELLKVKATLSKKTKKK